MGKSDSTYILANLVLGMMDGLTVGPALAIGMYAGGLDRKAILLAALSDMIAGSISMSLAEGLSLDTIGKTSDAPLRGGFLTGLGYLLGSSVPFWAFLISSDIHQGALFTLIGSIILLISFGYVRGKYGKESVSTSIAKVLVIGLLAMFVTYAIQSLINKTSGISSASV
jgi:VIT1/CCC1 family predicted Fe2+/Mn2+ transporter